LLEESGIISKADSKYAAPCFVKDKENGDLRILIDYRQLNLITEEEQNTFPTVRDSFHKMVGCKFFTKFDLRKGFYQIELKKEDRTKTAFVTPFGKYQWNRIPMGLKNPPKYFHNLIARALGNIENVAVFIDDIIVFSKSEEDHFETINNVLKILEDRNIIINEDKNLICEKEISYLGFNVSEYGYAPDKNRLEDFESWEKPKTKRQVQQLIGKINWYRPFLKDLSTKMKPFYDKVKEKKRKIKITDEEMNIVKEISKELKEKAYLYFPDLNEKFFINTDASETGIGAVLYQTNGIIAYFSKTLNDNQQKYSVVEKECLAILTAVQSWHTWIGGSKITVFTDSNNLLHNTGNFSKICERWKAEIQKLNVEFVHISGSENLIADHLSRKVHAMELSNENGCDKSLIEEIAYNHIINGHPGQFTTIQTIKQTRDLKEGESKMIKEYIRKCIFCQYNKHGSPTKSGLIEGCLSTTTPLKSISSDVFGPFDASHFPSDFESDKLYCITMIDRASRYTMIKFSKTANADDLINMLDDWSKIHGKPMEFLSDNGPCYIAESMADYCGKMGIKQIFATRFNPTGNAISERINSTILLILKIYKNWPLEIVQVIIENRLNTQYHSSIGRIPKSVLEEYSINPNLQVVNQPNNYDIEKINKSRRPHTYNIGDLILKKAQVKNKLDQLYIGPFKIISIDSNQQTLEVELSSNKTEKLNIKQVKPFVRG
ncbi:putative LTR retrotransposon, partial [Pseudoloma neurophilia]